MFGVTASPHKVHSLTVHVSHTGVSVNLTIVNVVGSLEQGLGVQCNSNSHQMQGLTVHVSYTHISVTLTIVIVVGLGLGVRCNSKSPQGA